MRLEGRNGVARNGGLQPNVRAYVSTPPRPRRQQKASTLNAVGYIIPVEQSAHQNQAAKIELCERARWYCHLTTQVTTVSDGGPLPLSTASDPHLQQAVQHTYSTPGTE